MAQSAIYLFIKKGHYYISYFDESGHRRQKSTHCKSKSDAVKVLSEFKKFLAEVNSSKRISLAAFTKEFLVFAKTNYAHHTVYLYEKMLGHFLRICGDLPLTKYTPKHYDLYKVTRLKEFVQGKIPKKALKRAMNPITVNIELRSLRAVFNTALRWEYIEKNPFDGLAQIPIPKRTPAFLTADDVESMLKVITRPWLKDVLIFAVNTGMRRGELLSLRWQDVDANLRVARIVNRDDFTTKSGEERVVALNDAALAVVQRCAKSDKHEYLFSREDGMRLLPDWLTAAFKNAARKAGLSEGIHLHSTRHSFASLLVGSGTSLFTVSKLLGHSNAKTSEIYSHLLPQHLHNEVDKLNVGGNPKKGR
jgi:integrase